MPRASVIIPTYNRVGWLAHAIESVLSQTYKDRELIVVDDASTDETAELLSRYGSALRTITLSPNQGVSASRNAGIQNSESPWIAFLDSDDRWLPKNWKSRYNISSGIPNLKSFLPTKSGSVTGSASIREKGIKSVQDGFFRPVSLCA